MIKKIIWLLVLGFAAYVGYLVWQKMTPDEQQSVKDKASKVLVKTKDLANSAADAISDKIHENKKDDSPASPADKAQGQAGSNAGKVPAEAMNKSK